MIHVINKKFYKGASEYVGRPSILGNPYSSKESNIAKYQCSCNEEAVHMFKKYLIDEIKNGNDEILNELKRLYLLSQQGDLLLGCWCVPFNDCHAEFIKKVLDNFHIVTKLYPDLI